VKERGCEIVLEVVVRCLATTASSQQAAHAHQRERAGGRDQVAFERVGHVVRAAGTEGRADSDTAREHTYETAGGRAPGGTIAKRVVSIDSFRLLHDPDNCLQCQGVTLSSSAELTDFSHVAADERGRGLSPRAAGAIAGSAAQSSERVPPR
jgi:hypothetical protein